MTLHKLAAGSGYTYLTRQVAAHDRAERSQVGLAAYYEQKGESPGRWLGSGIAGLDLADRDVVTEEQMKLLFGQGRHPRSQEPDAVALGGGALGRPFPTFAATTLRQEVATALSAHNTSHGRAWNAPIPTEERARIRTEVADAAFARTHGRAPRDATELTGFVATASKPAQTPVAGFDLTFSPVKSVSALWALAEPDVVREVEAAHEAAVRATISLLEREVAFTRVGKGGIRQVPVTGLVAAAFDHRDSRAGDPDLHTHVVISNKVQTLPDEGGKWLTLDGRMVFKAKVMASEHYNTRLEAELTERLGVRFTERPSPAGRRPVREIEGMEPRLLHEWSSRRGDITSRQRQLGASFQADHGRAPTRIESLALAQQANLETRPDKHEPRSLREQRGQWRAEADAVLAAGDDAGPTTVRGLVSSVLGRAWGQGAEASRYEGGYELATRVVDVLESSRSTWQVWHVRAEALRQARYAGIPLSSLDETVANVVARATLDLSLTVGVVPDLGEPEFLRRPDGASVYTVHGSRTYTSAAILDAERRLLEAGERTDGYVIPELFVDLAIRRGSEAGAVLDTGQAELVSALATSGARVQVALAPAGSGKTTAMATLAKAWRGGGGQVIGLAPTAVAADELGQAIDTPAETVAKFLHSAAAAERDDQVAAFPPIGPRTLVVIDEAGMVGTKDLAAVVDRVLERGGSVRLVGDDQQLTAVAASGVFRDLAEQGFGLGATARLTELHRFSDPEEAAATLGIRSGDPAALEHYLEQGRVHVGDAGSANDQAFAAWRADIAAGRSSLLLAASRDTVRELNEQARADRLEGQAVGPDREAVLVDGTRASAGDVIITRHNDRSLRDRDGSWVKNGDRWIVRDIDRNGNLYIARAGHHASRVGAALLLADYVEQYVQLGYASTIHSAQGTTVDTTHTVVAGTESRQGLYVALSRGRIDNHLYLSDAEPVADGVALDLPADRGPREVLTSILERDDRAESATRAGAADPARELAHAIQQYEDALPLLAQHVIGDPNMRALDSALDKWMPGLCDQPGYPGLRGQIALRWVDGESPDEVLRQATWWHDQAELLASEDPAAELARSVSRLGPAPASIGPMSWVSAAPNSLRDHAETGPYLDRMAGAISELVVATNQGAGSTAQLESRLSTAQRQHDRRQASSQAAGRRTPGFGR